MAECRDEGPNNRRGSFHFPVKPMIEQEDKVTETASWREGQDDMQEF